ncbi:hypothetical protein CS063_05135 [Sporanaerobium hydrogeniformans]|uniref:Uncharacterized protein n=1 Tax=Sporanaerobium hydrogeniformans TaxID=3072179 RepID=A0AC61DDU2_9FIRM|nr:hypothetical protein [Sporanaerobium hydrogeniformans]PHV71434.1 hypothetical protein CS063_05135 [Sporanaerobium hydrogeniformans]
MKKSVYSLVLMDEVIEQVDALAYSMNTSRSNLINQILAEKVALVTPQQHMQEVFETMVGLLRVYQNFQIQEQLSDSLCTIRSILKYKYNPTIRYTVTLGRKGNQFYGEVKVISRTQSAILHQYLKGFFTIWSSFERKQALPGWYEEEGTRWVRPLSTQRQQGIGAEELGRALSGYIKAVDDGLKIYFSHLEDSDYTGLKVYEHYRDYIKKSPFML